MVVQHSRCKNCIPIHLLPYFHIFPSSQCLCPKVLCYGFGLRGSCSSSASRLANRAFQPARRCWRDLIVPSTDTMNTDNHFIPGTWLLTVSQFPWHLRMVLEHCGNAPKPTSLPRPFGPRPTGYSLWRGTCLEQQDIGTKYLLSWDT